MKDFFQQFYFPEEILSWASSEAKFLPSIALRRCEKYWKDGVDPKFWSDFGIQECECESLVKLTQLKNSMTLVQDAINEIHEEKIVQPRLNSQISILQEVEKHFLNLKSKPDLSTVSLYATALQCSDRLRVMAFLYACSTETTESLYYSIPTDIFSVMKGKPCKTRDFEPWQQKKVKGIRLQGRPALFTHFDNTVNLVINGVIKQSIVGIEAKCMAPIPTNSVLEQFVIVCSEKGDCRIFSTTRKNIMDLGTFQLDVPEHEKLDWINVRNYKDKTIVQWGGTDSLRGSVSWQFFCGLDVGKIGTKEDFFYQISDDEVEACDAQIAKKCKEGSVDYETYGNELTAWINVIDSEQSGKRIWIPKCRIVMNNYLISETASPLVWGFPNLYYEIDKSKVKIMESGIETTTFQLNHTPELFCVLMAHGTQKELK